MKKPRELKVLSREWAEIPSKNYDFAERAACAECGLWTKCLGEVRFALPLPPSHSPCSVALVVDHPLNPDQRTRLGRLVRKAGLEPDECAVIPALRCLPTGRVSMKQIRACRPFLLRALLELKPRYVIGLGEQAAKALANDGACGSIAYLRGKCLEIEGIDASVWVTYSPSASEHSSHDYTPRVIEDLSRPVMPITPWPKLSVVRADCVAIDSEFSQSEGGKIYSLALATRTEAENVEPKDAPVHLQRVSAIIGHSIAEDITTLVKLGAAKEEWVQGYNCWDSLLLARMADENRGKGNYGVEALLRSGHNVDPWKHKTEEYGVDPKDWPTDLMEERCRLDAWASYVVAQDFWSHAKGPVRLAHRIALALKRVELAGMFVDMEAFGSFARKVKRQATKLKRELQVIAKSYGMEAFEPTNDYQIRELVYERMKLPVSRMTDKGVPAVHERALKDFKDQHQYFESQLAFNKADKLISTYCESLRDKLEPAKPATVDGVPVMWLPTRINPLGARTGRRSSGANPFEHVDESGVNYQNWPKAFRPVVRSRFRGGVITDNDYSKLEIILMGWYSGEEELVRFFTESKNGYIEVGRNLFGKEVQEGTNDYRVMKSIILGVQYNMKDWKLAEDLRDKAGVMLGSTWDDHLAEAGQLRAKYLDRFPGIRRFQRACIEEVHRDGQVVGALGQTRRLLLPPEPPRSERLAHKMWRRQVGHIENEACNFKIQWLASLVTGTAMLDVESRLLYEAGLTYTEYHTALLEKRWPRMPLLVNEVHDDLVFDIPSQRRDHDVELIHTTMEELPTLRRLIPDLADLPIKVDTKIGQVWGLAEH